MYRLSFYFCLSLQNYSKFAEQPNFIEEKLWKKVDKFRNDASLKNKK